MPEILTEVEPQSAQASNADLCRAAQEHYDKISTAAHEWHSAIPKAIDAYFADPERARLERDVINAAKADLGSETRKEGDVGIDRLIAARRAYRAAVLALIEFESSQQQVNK